MPVFAGGRGGDRDPSSLLGQDYRLRVAAWQGGQPGNCPIFAAAPTMFRTVPDGGRKSRQPPVNGSFHPAGCGKRGYFRGRSANDLAANSQFALAQKPSTNRGRSLR